ncbi:MAG TPA: hypothetical protein DHV07_00870 [Flavobacteriales bacterium]|nr:hypothetical protein [Flavobacteriales bacterium]
MLLIIFLAFIDRFLDYANANQFS